MEFDGVFRVMMEGKKKRGMWVTAKVDRNVF